MTYESERAIMLDMPMSGQEIESAAEVFDQYPGLDRVAAWVALKKRAYETSRPFRAYDCAHAVASALINAEMEGRSRKSARKRQKAG